MSRIADIYAQVAGWELQVGGKPATAHDLATMLTKVDTAQLPARLLAVTNGRLGGVDAQFTALRGAMVVTWQITDLLLYKPLAQGRGLGDVSAQLAAYAGDWLEAVKAQRKPLPVSDRATAKIVAARVLPGVYQWPEGGQSHYYGVECVLDIEELL